MRAVQPRPCSSLGTRVTTKAPDLRISKKNIAEREIFTASTFGKPSHRKGAISSKLTAFKETSQGRRPKSAVEKLTGSAWESHRNAIEAVKKKVKKTHERIDMFFQALLLNPSVFSTSLEHVLQATSWTWLHDRGLFGPWEVNEHANKLGTEKSGWMHHE